MDCAKMGQRIKERREELGYTKEALCQLVHVGPSSMCLIEQGKRVPGLETFEALCRALNTSADYLLGLDELALCHLLPSDLTYEQRAAGLEMLQVLRDVIWKL